MSKVCRRCIVPRPTYMFRNVGMGRVYETCILCRKIIQRDRIDKEIRSLQGRIADEERRYREFREKRLAASGG